MPTTESSTEEKLYHRLKRLERRVRLWQLGSIGGLLLCTAILAALQLRTLRSPAQVHLAYGNATATLTATALSLVDQNGARTELRPTGLRFFNGRGVELAALTFEGDEGQPSLWLHDAPGRSVVGMSIGDGGRPELVLTDGNETTLARLSIAADSIPTLSLRDARGLQQVLTPTMPLAKAAAEPGATP